jgi:hypothetical protein
MKQPAVMPFDVERMLPEVLRRPVVDTAERIGAPIEFAAVSHIAVGSGITQRSIQVQPKQLDESWRMAVTVWAALIGPPGAKKSPTARHVMTFIRRKEKEWYKAYREALSQHAEEDRVARIQIRRQDVRINQIIRDGVGDDEIPPAIARPAVPAQRRLVTGNITLPKLQDLGAEPQNWRGLFRFDDEAIRFFSRMDAEAHADERAFYLAAESGEFIDPCDRISRQGRHAPDGQSVVVFGCMTPDALRGYTLRTKDELLNDGLLQRFGLGVQPDIHRQAPRDTPLPQFALLEEAYERILGLEQGDALVLRFTPEAQEYFDTWRESRLRSLTEDRDLPPAIQTHFTKYEKLMAAVSALHCALDTGLVMEDNRIPLLYLEQTGCLIDCLATHARRIYSVFSSKDMVAAEKILEKIREGRLGANGFVRGPDVYAAHWSGLDDPKRVNAGLKILCETGWLRVVNALGGAKGSGRPPAVIYEVNPLARKAV